MALIEKWPLLCSGFHDMFRRGRWRDRGHDTRLGNAGNTRREIKPWGHMEQPCTRTARTSTRARAGPTIIASACARVSLGYAVAGVDRIGARTRAGPAENAAQGVAPTDLNAAQCSKVAAGVVAPHERGQVEAHMLPAAAA